MEKQDTALLTVQEEARRASTEYVPQSVTNKIEPEQQAGQPTFDLEAVNAMLKQHYGKTLDDLIAKDEPVKSVDESPKSDSSESLPAMLAKEWGTNEQETERRIRVVLEEFSKLSPEEQELYDNPKGAKVLWERYEKSNKPPVMDKGISSVSKTEPTYLFTQEQIAGMSEDERRRNHSAILAAYATGKVAG